MAFVCCQMQCCPAPAVGYLHAGPPLQKQMQAGQMAIGGCTLQRCPSVAVDQSSAGPGARRAAVLAGQVALACRKMQCCHAITVIEGLWDSAQASQAGAPDFPSELQSAAASESSAAGQSGQRRGRGRASMRARASTAAVECNSALRQWNGAGVLRHRRAAAPKRAFHRTHRWELHLVRVLACWPAWHSALSGQAGAAGGRAGGVRATPG